LVKELAVTTDAVVGSKVTAGEKLAGILPTLYIISPYGTEW